MNESEERTKEAPDEEGLALLQALQEAMSQGEASAIEAAAANLFAYACDQAEEESDPNLLLRQQAHHHETSGQWREAETAYRRCLALAQEQNQPVQVFKAHADLSRLRGFLGQKEPALEAAHAALEAARDADMKPLIGAALESLGYCYLEQGSFLEALEITDTLVRMLPTENVYDTQKGRALVLRARCYGHLCQTARAEQDLTDALLLLTPLSNVTFFAGVQSGLANWWEATAQLKVLSADFAAAVEAGRKAVEYRRTVSQAFQLEGPYKHASLACSLEDLGELFLAVQDAKGSEEAFEESRAIREAIHQPAQRIVG